MVLAGLARGRARLPLGGAWCREKLPEGCHNALSIETFRLLSVHLLPTRAKFPMVTPYKAGAWPSQGKRSMPLNGPGGSATPGESKGGLMASVDFLSPLDPVRYSPDFSDGANILPPVAAGGRSLP